MIISFVPDTELMALTVCLGDCDDPHQMRPGKLSLHSRQTVTIKIQLNSMSSHPSAYPSAASVFAMGIEDQLKKSKFLGRLPLHCLPLHCLPFDFL